MRLGSLDAWSHTFPYGECMTWGLNKGLIMPIGNRNVLEGFGRVKRAAESDESKDLEEGFVGQRGVGKFLWG